MQPLLQTLEISHPRAAALIAHAASRLDAVRGAAHQDFYARQPSSFFDHLDQEVQRVLTASARTLPDCLRDLDAFNALTEEVENDLWYDQPAAFTSMHLDALLPGFAQRRLAALAAALAEACPRSAAMIEIGCGSGALAARLLRQHSDWRGVLVDRSTAAVQFCRAYLQATGLSARCEVRRGDLAQLPAADQAFDIAIAAEVLEHAPQPRRSVLELLRVLRPAGVLAISVPIDLDIAMHPVVFRDEAAVQAFFAEFPLRLLHSEVVRADPSLDAIVEVFPDFQGCVNLLLRKVDSAEGPLSTLPV